MPSPRCRARPLITVAVAVASALSGPTSHGAQATASGHDGWKRTGDVLAVGLPALAIATTYWVRSDDEGLKDLAWTLVGTWATSEVLKRGVHSTRPDGSDDRSFPSRHTALAFAAVRYLDRRYGYDAEPWTPWLYASASLTGAAMVQAERHRWRDVVAGGALGWGVAHWATTPYGKSRVAVVPLPGGFALSWQAAW